MAKTKNAQTESPSVAALDDTTPVPAGKPVANIAIEPVPDLYAPQWTGFIMGKFRAHELHDGCPTYPGLRRVAADYLGDVGNVFVQAPQTPNSGNGNHSCVIVSMTIDHPGEFSWLGRLAGRSIVYSDGADIFHGNGSRDLFAWRHSLATCITRVKARLLRDAFRLEGVYAKEELAELPAGDSGADGYINSVQVKIIDMLCGPAPRGMNINAAKFLGGIWKHCCRDAGDDLNRVPRQVADKAIAFLQPWQQDPSKIDERVKNGYDPNWLAMFQLKGLA